jgi:lipoyl(octanoyl) transferase
MQLRRPATARHDREPDALRVYLLGLLDFDSALALQEQLVDEVACRDDGSGILLLCEHPPLITIGRSGSRSDVLPGRQELDRLQIPLRWISRGGGTVIHSPGQLAVYPIVPLKRRGLGLEDFVSRMQSAVFDLAAELRMPVDPEQCTAEAVCGRCGEFATLGAAVRNWVSCHGLFVNVCPANEFLRLVRPGGRPKPASIQQQRQRAASMHSIRERMIRLTAQRMEYDRHYVFTGHPLLKRTTRKVYVPA